MKQSTASGTAPTKFGSLPLVNRKIKDAAQPIARTLPAHINRIVAHDGVGGEYRVLHDLQIRSSEEATQPFGRVVE